MENISDNDVERAAVFSGELHAWMCAQNQTVLASVGALAYELASVIAASASSVSEADALIDAWTDTMKEQVRHFGVGIEHP